MELRDYLRIVRRRWRLISGCLLITVAIGAALTYTMTPMYASSARLFVSTTPSSSSEAYQGGLFSAQRVSSYADLVTGQELSRRVIEALDLDMEPSELAGKLEASVAPDTVILEVTAVDPDPSRAQLLAQTTALELTGFVDELETTPGRANAPIKATVVDSAPLPGAPVTPQPIRNLGLAVVLGLLFGLGLAVLREMLDTTVKSADDLTSDDGAAVMGHIAFDANAAKQPLITSLGSHSPRVEAFRVLRTNMQFVDVDNPSKTFVVSSSVPGEGKTTTATNLAITLAQAGQHVLLIEADLRRPKVSENLRLEASVGLTTVLVGRLELADAIQPYAPIPNLSVLASGAIPPNPSELLQSQAMADVLDRSRKEFDVIVIDAPPLLPVTDAALLTAQADGALLVVRHGKTTKDQLRHAVERLAAVDGKVLGVVLNMVPQRRGGGDAYGYGYGYGYGYAPETGRRSSKTTKRRKGSEGRGSLEDVGFTEN